VPCWSGKESRGLAVRWADEAVTDLADIVGYIEVHDLVAAQGLLDDILRMIEQLPLMPSLFRPGRVEDTREILVTSSVFCETTYKAADKFGEQGVMDLIVVNG
jgi:plasmid stabilization system protein ParE